MGNLRIGLDLGSTAVKAVVLDEAGRLCFSAYERHHYRVQETAEAILQTIAARFPERSAAVGMTGAEAMEMAGRISADFVQELTAESRAIQAYLGQVDAAVELGGEDAKVTYFREGQEPDRRMNRTCAGGTGSFLDHLALFLRTDAAGLDGLAAQGTRLYPIAARCGVFAKTDVQGLLNEGARKEDIALSVFQAIVNQVVSGLARGCPIRGRVVFLGGPLTFLPHLRERFIETLHLPRDAAIVPEHGELYAALGAALSAGDGAIPLSVLCGRMKEARQGVPEDLEAAPLFASEEEYAHFCARHQKAQVRRGPLTEETGPVWLGIDAGSTTLKAVLMDQDGAVLADWYGRHGGDVLAAGKKLLRAVYQKLPRGVRIAGAGVTGYGEDMLKEAFQIDRGEVETMAHLRAARFFCPDLTALLDIGGQDMKYIRLRDGVISQISLNGSCASGCGSFLETFAGTLHMTVQEFAQKAIHADHALDLGYRCTVLMNSKVRQVQKDTMDPGALAAALCTAVVKNALYRVVRLTDASDMGDRVVVEGGTFYNDAVLRALEKILGHDVVRPDLAGLMGAYGMALLARENYGADHLSSLITAEEAERLTVTERQKRCGGCGNRCMVTEKKFSTGASFVTGNRCEKGALLFAGHGQRASSVPDLYQWKRDHLFRTFPVRGTCRGMVGIPAALTMWEDFPYWAAFFGALGYRVIRSDFRAEGMGETAGTIPENIYCQACQLAHIHLWDLLQKKPDLIWMPVTDRGREEPEIDERTHARYGDILAEAMKEDIAAAAVDVRHPHVPPFGSPAMAAALEKEWPDMSAMEIQKAIRAGEAAQRAYYEGLREETRKALDLIKSSGREGILLCGRSYHADPQIHKGIPHLITSLGVTVLSGEGIWLLGEKGDLLRAGDHTLRERLLSCAALCEKEENLHMVQMHSVSCGYDGLTVLEAERRLKAAGKIYTVLSLDQGMNAGAIRIRLRSLLAEIDEFKAHPEARRKFSAEGAAPVHPVKKLYLPRLSPLYDPLLLAAFVSSGYEAELLPRGSMKESAAVLPEEAGLPALAACGAALQARKEGKLQGRDEALLLLSSPQDAAMVREGLRAAGHPGEVRYFDCGRRQGNLPVTLSLLHHFFTALFLGDLLQRILLAARPAEGNAGSTEKAVMQWIPLCEDTVRAGTFAAYEETVQHILTESGMLKRNGLSLPLAGIAGDPFLFYPAHLDSLLEKEGCCAACMGLGEWYVDAISMTYWTTTFGGNRDEAEACWAARNLGASYMNALSEALRPVPWLDGIETDMEKRKRIRQRLDHPEETLPEQEQDLLRRGAAGILSVTALSAFGQSGGEGTRLSRLHPELPCLTAELHEGMNLTNLGNRIKLFAERVKGK